MEATDAAVETPVAPSETTFEFNGQTYNNAAELQMAATNMSTSLQSDYTKKTQAAADELKKAEALKAALAEDIDYLAAHPEVLATGNPLQYYSPKVQGGSGEIARVQSTSDDYTPESTASAPAFNNDPLVKALQAELAEVKQTINGIQSETNETGLNRVVNTKSKLLAAYPNADENHVNMLLETYYYQNGKKHANDAKVEEFIKKDHLAVTKKIAEATKGVVKERPPQSIQSATPTATGVIATPDKPKAPKLEDAGFNDWIAKTTKSFLGGQGG